MPDIPHSTATELRLMANIDGGHVEFSIGQDCIVETVHSVTGQKWWKATCMDAKPTYHRTLERALVEVLESMGAIGHKLAISKSDLDSKWETRIAGILDMMITIANAVKTTKRSRIRDAEAAA